MNDDQTTWVDPGDGPRVRLDAAAFEALLADVSLRFACLRHEELVDAVRDTIERLRRSFGYDRAVYAEFRTPETVEVMCSSAAPGTVLRPIGLISEDLGWLRSEIAAAITRKRVPRLSFRFARARQSTEVQP